MNTIERLKSIARERVAMWRREVSERSNPASRFDRGDPIEARGRQEEAEFFLLLLEADERAELAEEAIDRILSRTLGGLSIPGSAPHAATAARQSNAIEAQGDRDDQKKSSRPGPRRGKGHRD